MFFDESYNVTCPYLFSSIGEVLRECRESCGLVCVMFLLKMALFLQIILQEMTINIVHHDDRGTLSGSLIKCY